MFPKFEIKLFLKFLVSTLEPTSQISFSEKAILILHHVESDSKKSIKYFHLTFFIAKFSYFEASSSPNPFNFNYCEYFLTHSNGNFPIALASKWKSMHFAVD
jgi:hypothetical protein